MTPSVIERAYQLASSGHCKSVIEIESALQKEKYEFVYIHMRGLGLRRALKRLILIARDKKTALDMPRRAAGEPQGTSGTVEEMRD